MKRLLVVDDDSAIYKLIEMMVTQDVDIDYSCDPVEAIDKIRENSYDLMLFDYVMPKINGITMARIARKEIGVQCPIYLFTNYTIRSVKEKLKEEGVHVNEVFEKVDLDATLKKILG